MRQKHSDGKDETMKTTDRRPSRGSDIRVCAKCFAEYEALAERFKEGHECDPLWLEAASEAVETE